VGASGYLIVEPDDSLRTVAMPRWTPSLVDFDSHHLFGGTVEQGERRLIIWVIG
jgi:hypothetical protein